MEKKICLIYNYAQHYRKGIYIEMDKQLKCDFYFGDKYLDVEKLDYSLLHNFKKEVKNFSLLGLKWQQGIVRLIFRPYTHYIVLGDYSCVSTWMILLISKFTSKKTLVWTHGWYGNEGKLKKIIKKVFFRLSDYFLLYGNYARDLMIKEGFKFKKLYTIYNSLDYFEQIEIRKDLVGSSIYKERFNNNAPTLIFIGRLTKVKRLGLLLSAVAKLKNQELNIVIVGDGEESSNLKSLSTELGIKNIWFYGSVYNEKEISELLFNSTVCVAPGNVGLTAMHSLTYGVPVITHNNLTKQMPEFEAVIDGETGTFFEYNNADLLAKAISTWLNYSIDKRESIRNNCYEVIDSKFNPIYQISVFNKIIFGI